MADTVRTRATILSTLFPDNTTQLVSPQDQRDALVSSMGVGASIYTSGGSTATSVGNVSYVEIPFDSDGVDDHAIADSANNRIEVGGLGDGDYLVLGQLSFTGTASTVFTIKAAINGTESDAVSCKQAVDASGSVVSASLVGLLSLSDGDLVTLKVIADGASKSFTLREGSLTIKRLW